MNPEKHLLDVVHWQFFCSFTFKTLKMSETAWMKMFFAMMREQADNFGVHFPDLMWVLRKERGEISARLHYHALIAGLPEHAVKPATCFSFMKIWEKHGGGISRVRVYDPTLDGVGYVLKGVDAAFANLGANWYELKKFGQRCDVTLSLRLIRHMQKRSSFGPRGHDGLFTNDLQPRVFARRRRYSRNRKSRKTVSDKCIFGLVEKAVDRHAINTLQSGVREFGSKAAG